MNHEVSSKPENIKRIEAKLENSFFGFWIKYSRISYLITLGVVMLGVFGIISIPKESTPNIPYGIVSIVVSYPGTNPIDMDALVTEKIEKEIKDISGIKKMSSTSSLGLTSIVLELETSAKTSDVLNEVRNATSRVILPTDAKAPVITEIKSDTERVFSVILYGKTDLMSDDKIRDRAQTLKESLETVPEIASVEIEGTNIYDMRVIFDAAQLDAMKLSLTDIANALRSYHRDVPLGNYAIDNKNYDFRIEGKFKSDLDVLNAPIPLPNNSTIYVRDLAKIERVWKDDSIRTMGTTGNAGNRYVSLKVLKKKGIGVFRASDAARARVNELLVTPAFSGLSARYSLDIADNIRDDYTGLSHDALMTILLVFIAMFLYIGLKDAIISTVFLPLAFFSTFFILYVGGYSLNFLTNFSLVLSFGIAIDTIIVILQWSAAKMRIGYNPKHAVILALQEYAVPIIAGVLTNIVAFIPMMSLPGVLGKYLAYIPITIFCVLATGLVFALTVNSALYLALARRQTGYIVDDALLEFGDEDEKQLLYYERQWKTELRGNTKTFRIRVLESINHGYKNLLSRFLRSTTLRIGSIIVPLLFLAFTAFVFPGVGRIGFELFPSSDNPIVSVTIQGAKGERTEVLAAKLGVVGPLMASIPEVKFYTLRTLDDTSTLAIELYKTAERKAAHQRSSFQVETYVMDHLRALQEQGLKVESKVASSGPPSGKPVGVKIISKTSGNLDTLIQVSRDFEKYLKTVPGAKNVSNTSADTPGQFVFSLNKAKINALGVSSAAIFGELSNLLSGINIGSIVENNEDISIILKSSDFIDTAEPRKILDHPFSLSQGRYVLGDFLEYNVKNAISTVQRVDGNIYVGVDADLEANVKTSDVQPKLEAYARSYKYPTGIEFLQGGENEANKDLLQAVTISFLIAVLLIFIILVFQFNSFLQPFIILYSILTSLVGVMWGLYWTGHPFSLPFGIGFISLTGIAVNHAIILIDAINRNLHKGMEGVQALVEAGYSRLEPMTLTTITTILGIYPLAIKDEFWAGLGYTIIFGLVFASAMTLFVVKGLYYEAFLNPHGPIAWVRNFKQKLLHQKDEVLSAVTSVQKNKEAGSEMPSKNKKETSRPKRFMLPWKKE